MLKKRNMSFNMAASLICQIVTLISGLVVQRYILLAFGSTYNGLTSLISQVMSYLVLLEAGLGAASTQALYKPLSDNDWVKASGIMNATAISYRNVGFMFSALLVGGALIVPLIASGEVEFVIAALLTLLIGGSHIFTYMISGKYSAFLTAERKTYVRYTFTTITTILSTIFRVVALSSGVGIIAVQAIGLFFAILNGVLISLYVIKNYKQLDRSVKPDFPAIGKRWNVLIHQLSGLVVTHNDVLIISLGDTLKQVSVFSSYNMIYSHLGAVLQSTFLQAPQGDFGRVYSKDKAAFEKMYAVYETLITIVTFIICSIALVMTLPFIALYTEGITDAQYINQWYPVLFVAVFFMNNIRTPAMLTVNAAGAFKETQWGAIVEMVINLVASLTLFFFTDLGICGLLLGKVISYLFRTPEIFIYVYRNLINRSCFKLFRLLIANIAAFAVIAIIFFVLFPVFTASYFEWVLWAIIITVVSLITYLAFNFAVNFSDTKAALSGLISKLRKRNSN